MFIEKNEDGQIVAAADYCFSPRSSQTDKEVVRGWDGKLYIKGEEPPKPQPPLQEQVARLEAQYGMNRWQREGILNAPENYSALVVSRAKEIEALTASFRKEEK